MLNPLLGVEFNNQLLIEILSILSIVSYQFCWQAITTNQILLDNPLNYLSCYICIRVGLYLFGELVDGHQDEHGLIANLWVNWSYDIQSLHIKRLKQGQIEQRC
jgi:hypothetical protein